MTLTLRCRDLLRLLQAARWLSTSQIHRRFFASSTKDAARKRVRILAKARYLFQVRQKNSWVDSGSGNLPSE